MHSSERCSIGLNLPETTPLASRMNSDDRKEFTNQAMVSPAATPLSFDTAFFNLLMRHWFIARPTSPWLVALLANGPSSTSLRRR